jgi:hypothetical protein
MSTSPVVPTPKSPTIFGVSKSTVQGDLSLAVVALLILSQMQLPAIASTNVTHLWIWITWAAAGIAGILKAILARTQGDATS